MERATIDLHTRDELTSLDLSTVEQLLRNVRALRSRLDGQEAALHSAIGVLRPGGTPGKGPQPPRPKRRPASANDDKAPSGSRRPAGDDAPEPTTSAERAALARARRLEAHPDIAGGLESGAINTEQADALARAIISAEARGRLLAEAAHQTADETMEAIAAARRDEERGDARRRLARQRDARHANRGVDQHTGMYWMRGSLDPIIGSCIAERFDDAKKAEWQRDKLEGNPLLRRSAGQLAADAFVRLILGDDADELLDLSAAAARPETSPDAAGPTTTTRTERPPRTRPRPGRGVDRSARPSTQRRHRVNLVVRLDDGDFSRAAAARTSDGASVPASTIAHLLPDAEVLLWLSDTTGSRFLLATDDRLANDTQRQCLAIRDGGCVWRGCDASPTACEAHHLIHSHEGGATTIDNLALLCPTHHRQLHQMGAHLRRCSSTRRWTIEQDHTRRVIDSWAALDFGGSGPSSQDGRQVGHATGCGPISDTARGVARRDERPRRG